jgi:hypothetical protein
MGESDLSGTEAQSIDFEAKNFSICKKGADQFRIGLSFI